MQLILKVITDKKDRFTIRTLVQIVWALAKLGFNDPSVIAVLANLRDYPRLQDSLEGMY